MTQLLSSGASHFGFHIDNSCGDVSISFKLYIRVKHHKIRSSLIIGVIRKILTELWPFFDLDFG